MRKTKIKTNFFAKFFSVILIIFLISPFSAAQALIGGSFKAPSPTQSMNEIMGDLGIDKNEVKNSAATFNASRQKKQAPQVPLEFAPANPVEGQEVTVEATPNYFGNDLEYLYYTWLLKHDDGSNSGTYTDSVSGITYVTDDGNVDWDQDGTVDLEDYKIEAARIIANGGFEWRKAQSDGHYSNLFSSQWDDDGYDAVYGGDDQRNKTDNPKCFVHDFNSGNEYEIECRHLFPDSPVDQSGDGDFDADEEFFWRTDPLNNDTAGSSYPDEANVIGLGQNTFRWVYQPGDKVTVAVEGVSFEPTQERDSSYKVMWAMPKNKCEPSDYVSSGSGAPTIGTTTTTLTPDITQVEACLTSDIDGSVTSLPVDDCAGGSLVVENWLDENGYDSDQMGAGYPTNNIIIGYGSAAEETNSDGITISSNTITLADRSSGVPHLNNDVIRGNTITKTTTRNTVVTEDGANNRLVSTVTDTVNLHIEDASGTEIYNTSWDEEPTTTYYQRDFDMNPDDLNDCLESNFMEPSEVNGGEKIKINLTATPDSPMNDPTGTNSDYLSVDAALENVTDTSFLQYDWEVFAGDTANMDDWGPQLTKAQLVESSQVSGLGVKTLRFKLALDPTPRFLKVRLTVTEKSTGAVMRKGIGSIVIPLNSSRDKIFVWNTRIIPNPTAGQPDLFTLDTEICRNNAVGDSREAERNAICPVLKNEVIGLRYTNTNTTPAGTQYLWTLNGKPITYENCFFQYCGDPDRQTNIAYFPVLGDVGTVYTVGLSVVPQTGSHAQKINLIRTFRVENPSADIISLDQYAQAVLLGNYIGLTGQQYPDYSQTDYQAVPTTTVNLQANRYPFSFPLDTTKTQWFVDGQETNITGPNLSFRVDKPIGNLYTVSFNTLYTQSLEKKNLMYTYWNVMPDQFFEIQISKAIDITMVPGLPGVLTDAKKAPSNKFLAAIFSGAPLYVSYLFRIVLTTLLLLFGAWIIFSLFPTPHEYKD